jgi:hypothetical protein
MNELALWLVRWLLAGSAIAIAVAVACFFLDRLSIRNGLGFLRGALLLCLAAPFLALLPPTLTIAGIETPAILDKVVVPLPPPPPLDADLVADTIIEEDWKEGVEMKFIKKEDAQNRIILLIRLFLDMGCFSI